MAEVESSIVVPCFNEAANLSALIENFRSLALVQRNIEVLLVNNGSTDETAAVLEREIRSDDGIRVVNVPSPDVGYGHGIMSGLRAARGRYLAWTHADGQTPPIDAITGLGLLRTSSDPSRTLVKGRRRGRPIGAQLFTGGMDAAARTLLGAGFVDVNAQPKCFPRALLSLATTAPNDLSLDLYFFWLARHHGFGVQTFDVHFGTRRAGESKWAFNWRSRARHIERTLRFMNTLRRHGR